MPYFNNGSGIDASHSTFIDQSVNTTFEAGKELEIPANPETIHYTLSGYKNPYVSAQYNRANVCHPETRIAVIQEIICWAKTTKEDTPQIFWLHGMAGKVNPQ